MYNLRRMRLVALCLALFASKANATIFTAVASGDFTSALTWGGVAPGTLLSSDVIVIPAGVNVTLSTLQTISGTTTLTIDGSLTSTGPGSALVMSSGTLAGSGDISIDSLSLGYASTFAFSGDIRTRTLHSTGVALSSGADITVLKTLWLTSGPFNLTSGSVTMGNHSRIMRAYGILFYSGGSLNLDSAYSATYSGVAMATGPELTGAGLDSLTIDNPGTVTLSDNINVDGLVTLTSGTLALNGKTLTFNTGSNLSASGSGNIMGSATSSLVVNSATGLVGSLRFATSGNTLNNLTINTGTTGTTAFGSDLNLNGTLTLNNGNLDMNGYDLIISGTGNIAAAGSGWLRGSTTSDVTINATAGLSGTLRFASSANTINNLTINTASGTVNLGNDLTITGTAMLSSGTLGLNGKTLTLGSTGNLATSGTGNIAGSSTSNLVVNSTTGLTGLLRLATGANTLNNITINTGSTSGVMLGTDLNINGTATLTSGMLSLNSYTLTFNSTGNLATSGTGSIMGSTTSDMVINSTTGLTGALRFASGGNELHNLTINTTSGSASLGSDLHVHGILTLSSGAMRLNGHDLWLETGSNYAASGSGTISGNSSSDITVNATAGLTGTLRFTPGANTINSLTVNTGASSSVLLGTDMTINGMLTLTNGSLRLNGRTLTIGTTGNLSASGSGSITGSTTSGLIINSTAGLSGHLHFTPGSNMLGNLTVNTGTGTNASMDEDLTLHGTLNLASGSLDLNGHDLTFAATSTVSSSGTGNIRSDATSNIAVNATAGLTGALRFATGGNTVNNFTLATSAAANTMLGSDLDINGSLNLTSGILSLNGSKLTFTTSGDFSTAGSGQIAGSSTSDIVVNTTAGLTGGLRFAATGNTLNNLTLNTGSASNTMLGSDVNITGMLTLTNGRLMLNGNTLTIAPTGNLSATGAGTITGGSTSNLVVKSTAGLTGTLHFTSGSNTLNNLTINTASTGNTRLGNDLEIGGTLALTSGSLDMNGYNLVMNNTSDLSTSGTGSLSASSVSDLTINATSGLAGTLRFTPGSSTIRNFTVNTGATGSVSLGSDLTASGLVSLSSGTLMLNGHALTFTGSGDLSPLGTGMLSGDALADIVINTTTGLSDTLHFAGGAGLLHNLTLNVSSGASVILGQDLTVNGMLTLTNGKLALNGHTLTLGSTGNIAASGSGSLMGSSTSNLVINSTTGVTGNLRFAAAGDTMNNITVNTGSASWVALGSDLTINGIMTLNSGALSLNGKTLTLNTGSGLSTSGTGVIMGGSTSNLVINSTSGLAGNLRFATTGSGGTINNLTVNTGSGSNVKLGSNLTINGMLTLTNGMLWLNGQQLTVGSAGSIATSGAGSIMGSATSDLVVNSTAGPGGALNFATGGNMLHNLTVNTGSGSTVLNSDLSVEGVLSLDAGTLSLNGHTLTFGTGGNISSGGTGTIMGSSASGLVVNSTTGLSGNLRFAAGSNVLNSLTMNTGAGSTAQLGTDLTVNGSLHLNSGKLVLGTSNLTIGSAAMVNGGSSNSYVMTNSTGKLTMNLAAGARDTFKVGTATNYAPMVVAANSGSASGNVSIYTADGVLENGTSGSLMSATRSVVNTTWHVSSSVSTGINYNLTAMWSAGMEYNGFNRSRAYLSHYTSGAWDAYAASAAGTSGSMYTITRANVTSLSPFMVADSATTTPTTGTQIAEANSATRIYPNPATTVLHIASAKTAEKVCIFDVTGKCVRNISENTTDINVADLPTGNYIVRLTSGGTEYVHQFVKQ